MLVLIVVRCQHQVVIVGRIFEARSINWSLDCRHISIIVQSVVDRMRIGTIGWSVVDCMRIGTIGWSMDRRRIGATVVRFR